MQSVATNTTEAPDASTHTTVGAQTMATSFSGIRALRTVPVILKNGSKRIEAYALLDDASTKTYINSDIAAELNLQGSVQKINVSVSQ